MCKLEFLLYVLIIIHISSLLFLLGYRFAFDVYGELEMNFGFWCSTGRHSMAAVEKPNTTAAAPDIRSNVDSCLILFRLNNTMSSCILLKIKKRGERVFSSTENTARYVLTTRRSSVQKRDDDGRKSSRS